MSQMLINSLLYALLVVLLALSAFFSGSEIAYALANKTRLKKKADEGDRRAVRANMVSENYASSLSTILVGNDLVNIAASSSLTVIFVSYFGEGKGGVIAAVVATVVILIFGEIFPKIIATDYADSLVLAFARPLRFFTHLFYPIVAAVSALIKKLERLWTRNDDKEPAATNEELVSILETIEEEGVFNEKEGELIKSALEFPDVTARDILTPRVDVAAFDIEEGQELVFDNDELLTYSRFPVYRDSLDNVLGIAQTKQLVKASISDKSWKLEDLLTPPLYVHMTRPISSILTEFRRTHTHMAVVVDEFGGMMGILTLEDVIEELFGEIYDESDEDDDDETAEQTPDGSYEVDGTMNIEDMLELVGVDKKDFESEYTTVGGWATEVLDRFPKAGDSFVYKNIIVTVLEAEAMRVVKLRVDRLEQSEESKAE